MPLRSIHLGNPGRDEDNSFMRTFQVLRSRGEMKQSGELPALVSPSNSKAERVGPLTPGLYEGSLSCDTTMPREDGSIWTSSYTVQGFLRVGVDGFPLTIAQETPNWSVTIDDVEEYDGLARVFSKVTFDFDHKPRFTSLTVQQYEQKDNGIWAVEVDLTKEPERETHKTRCAGPYMPMLPVQPTTPASSPERP